MEPVAAMTEEGLEHLILLAISRFYDSFHGRCLNFEDIVVWK